ncbi:MAG: retropepsin-like domain-containing protein [Desulfurococcales archaeon]|nr:retropepsin-like domain-containing protein [Desulfurococcales archaeon]
MDATNEGLSERVFPYIAYRGRFYPIIPVIVEGREKAVVHALVDSGATVSLFHTSIAEDIGIDLTDAKQVYLAGVGGYVKAHLKKQVKVAIEGLGSIHIPIAFTEHIVSDLAILGRQGFFEAFEITFKEWEKKLIIKPKNPISH